MNTLEKLAKRDDAMNVAEVAKILGVSTQQIYKLASSNKIRRFHVGASIRFWPHEIVRFATGRLVPRKPPQSTRATHSYPKKKHGSSRSL
jgi:excisionase family DNA binding protein